MYEKIKNIIDNLGYSTSIQYLDIPELSKSSCIIAKKRGIFSTTIRCFLLYYVDEKDVQAVIKYIEAQKNNSLNIAVFKMNFNQKQEKYTYITTAGNIIHFIYLQPNNIVDTENNFISYWKSKHVNKILSAIQMNWQDNQNQSSQSEDGFVIDD